MAINYMAINYYGEQLCGQDIKCRLSLLMQIVFVTWSMQRVRIKVKTMTVAFGDIRGRQVRTKIEGRLASR